MLDYDVARPRQRKAVSVSESKSYPPYILVREMETLSNGLCRVSVDGT